MKKLLSLLLCLVFCLSVPVMAAEVPAEEPLFPKTVTYLSFPDVPAGHWAESSIRLCVETGLMKGTGKNFAPGVTLTNAEVMTLAARIHCAFNGGSFDEHTTPWYQGAREYLARHGITTGSPYAYTTRQGFFDLLSHVVPIDRLTPINKIKALPDTSDPTVLTFYNAGILTGVDAYGTFNGTSPLSRAECAAMVARIAEPGLRRTFTPAGQVPAGPFAENTLVMTVNGTSITYGQFLDVLLSLTQEIMDLYDEYDLPFRWDHSYNVDSWCNTLREATRHSLTASTIFYQEMTRLGCTAESEVPLTLFGTPTSAELTAKAAEEGLNRNQPGVNELLTELILEEKLDAYLTDLVEEASIITTPVYGQIDPHELWKIYNP